MTLIYAPARANLLAERPTIRPLRQKKQRADEGRRFLGIDSLFT